MTAKTVPQQDIHVVLVEPAIPQNTGNIARLTAATNTKLHLIEPLGFTISDRQLKRAGLDYWDQVQLSIHTSWQKFLDATGARREQLFFLSTHGKQSLYEAHFLETTFLVFGNETSGLPKSWYEEYREQLFAIPMDNPKVRSLNISSAVAVTVYEAKRRNICNSENANSISYKLVR